jgi:REP element-mobilizing transposase RayT
MKGYDYTLPGAFFVTILSKRREYAFGEVIGGDVVLSSIGHVIQDCWFDIPKHSPDVKLDEFIIMPNHLHGILFILESVGKGEAFSNTDVSLENPNLENASPLRPLGTPPGSLSAIIQNFKSVSTRMVNKMFFKPGNKVWQRNYFERIIRNDSELNAIRQYIIDNPVNWCEDEQHPANI